MELHHSPQAVAGSVQVIIFQPLSSAGKGDEEGPGGGGPEEVPGGLAAGPVRLGSMIGRAVRAPKAAEQAFPPSSCLTGLGTPEVRRPSARAMAAADHRGPSQGQEEGSEEEAEVTHPGSDPPPAQPLGASCFNGP